MALIAMSTVPTLKNLANHEETIVMDIAEKQRLATRILDLTHPYLPPGPHLPAQLMERWQQLMDRRKQALVEIYATHYSDEQLRALYDFHTGEMGMSIATTKKSVEAEINRRMTELHALPEAEATNSPRARVMIREIKENQAAPRTALFIRHSTLPGKRDEIRQLWERHMAPAIAANPGHTAYFYCFDSADANAICAFQQYISAEAAQDFLQSAAYLAYLNAVEPLLAGPPQVTTLVPLWSKGA